MQIFIPGFFRIGKQSAKITKSYIISKRILIMKMHIDISGQVTQLDRPSAMAFVRDDGAVNSVYLDTETKIRITTKHTGKTQNIVEKLHCILVYYCIKDYLENVEELIICRDINPRRLDRILLSLFKGHSKFPKITVRGHDKPESEAHEAALSVFRKKSKAKTIITEKMIESVLR
jgi:hypothetical protein